MKKNLSWLLPGVLAGTLVPLVVLLELFGRGALGANPISTLLNQFGLIAMVLLIASLACTPLQFISGWKWPVSLRKSLGLMGFFYASLHFLTYIGLDQLFNFKTIWEEVSQRPFILLGFTAFLLLMPLAATSTARAARRLGRNWQKLHYLVYLISPLVIIHFTMRMKADIKQPLLYGAVLSILLLTRVAARVVKQWRAPAWAGFRKFKVVKREPETGQVCSYYLAPLDGKKIPPYKPGQYLTFKLYAGGPSQAVIRCYSLSDRHTAGYYRISVKRVPPAGPDLPAGLASNYLHDRVRVNDILEVKAPSGRFVLKRAGRRPIVLIGGGIGVTPVLAMLSDLALSGTRREVFFFLGVRNSGDHCFREQLRRIASQNPRIRVRVCYSNPLPVDRLGLDYDYAGRISVALLHEILPSLHCDFYVCGPAAMMAQLKTGLGEAGVPAQNFRMEAFGAASLQKVVSSAVAGGKVNVTFEKSGATVAWDPASGTLLECAEAHGIAIDCGCRAGNCGTCAVAINSGEVDYTAEPGAVPEEGTCLACIAVPLSDLNVEA